MTVEYEVNPVFAKLMDLAIKNTGCNPSEELVKKYEELLKLGLRDSYKEAVELVEKSFGLQPPNSTKH